MLGEDHSLSRYVHIAEFKQHERVANHQFLIRQWRWPWSHVWIDCSMHSLCLHRSISGGIGFRSADICECLPLGIHLRRAQIRKTSFLLRWMVSHSPLPTSDSNADFQRWNCLAWVFGTASTSLFSANSVIAMYSLYHPDYVPQRWQVYICFLVITWSGLSLLLFGQRFVAKLFTANGILLLLVFVVITLVCAIMPSQNGHGYASNAFVWTDFENLTGWSSDGLVFAMGILNGAYAIGTPDAATHMAEEVCRLNA